MKSRSTVSAPRRGSRVVAPEAARRAVQDHRWTSPRQLIGPVGTLWSFEIFFLLAGAEEEGSIGVDKIPLRSVKVDLPALTFVALPLHSDPEFDFHFLKPTNPNLIIAYTLINVLINHGQRSIDR